jgi:hypothetical protein
MSIPKLSESTAPPVKASAQAENFSPCKLGISQTVSSIILSENNAPSFLDSIAQAFRSFWNWLCSLLGYSKFETTLDKFSAARGVPNLSSICAFTIHCESSNGPFKCSHANPSLACIETEEANARKYAEGKTITKLEISYCEIQLKRDGDYNVKFVRVYEGELSVTTRTDIKPCDLDSNYKLFMTASAPSLEAVLNQAKQHKLYRPF